VPVKVVAVVLPSASFQPVVRVPLVFDVPFKCQPATAWISGAAFRDLRLGALPCPLGFLLLREGAGRPFSSTDVQIARRVAHLAVLGLALLHVAHGVPPRSFVRLVSADGSPERRMARHSATQELWL